MKIIVLGSGTSIPMPHRASPSILLFLNDNPVLLDMGPGTLRQLSRTGISHEKIKHIILSHFHPDHTADLIHFLFVTRNPPTRDTREHFCISGPEGLKELIEKLKSVYNGWLDVSADTMEIEEYGIKGPFYSQYENYSISSIPLKHTPNSLAYRIENHVSSIVYSGDTGFSTDLAAFAWNTDLLILECSMPEGKEIEGHLTPSQAGRMAQLAGARKLLLVHFYPEVLATDIAGECRKYYDGELILAEDMMHIAV